MRRAGAAVVALLALGAVACAPRTPPAGPAADGVGGPDTLRVQVIERGRAVVRVVPLEAYVSAVAVSEFAPASGVERDVERMLEVQAIVARTYAAAHRRRHAAEGFDLCATTHCQLYEPGRLDTSRWAAAARLAAARTAGRVIVYAGAPADALYHADCGGRTSAAADVWGGAPVPYLRARSDLGSAAAAHRVWQYATDLDSLRGALVGAGLLPPTAPLTDVIVQGRDDSGRVTAVSLEGSGSPAVRGTALRDACTRAFGARAVRSTRFTIARAGRTVTFTGTGFGHGVGLCQAGAFARIAAGDPVDRVLDFYYPGTRLTRGRPLTPSSHTRPD